MGIETTKALQARRRESAAQIERLIAQGRRAQPDRLGTPGADQGDGTARPPARSGR